MIGYHITTSGIYCSNGTVRKEAPYLEWLLEDHPEEPKIFYDMDSSVASLMKLIDLSRDEGEKLATKKKVTLTPYKITYYPRIFFAIDKGFGIGHLFVNYMNAGQYIDTHFQKNESPDEALQKAKTAKETGDRVMKAFDNIGINMSRAFSPVNAFLKQYDLHIPTVDNIPEEAQEAAEYAYDTVKGNWLEAWQRGYWPEAYDYDISGAYASEMAKLLHIGRGRWVKSLEPPAEAVYGFGRGWLTTAAEFHPFLFRDKDNRNIGELTLTPIGSREDTLTLEKIRFLREYGLGKWVSAGGWWWIPLGQQFEFLKGPINHLWSKRNEAESMERSILKRVMAGIWGKMLEVKGPADQREFGEYFNPIYGSIVENNIQIKDAKVCLENKIIPLQLAVDGIITDKKLKLDEGPGLGQWRLSHKGKCIIVSCGVVGFEGKDGAEEFSLKYEWLEAAIKKNPRKKEYAMTKYSPLTLTKALNSEWTKLGEIEEVTRRIYIKEDSKRMWMDTPKNGGDLLKRKFTSAPWECSMLNIGG
jgi:hypothetical protein